MRVDLLCRGGGTVDAADLKSSVLTDVWVRFPPSVPTIIKFNIGVWAAIYEFSNRDIIPDLTTYLTTATVNSVLYAES